METYTIFSLAYLAGFINADGGFLIKFRKPGRPRKGGFNFEIVTSMNITQSMVEPENKQFFENLKRTFEHYGLTWSYIQVTKTVGRIEVIGATNMAKLIKLFDEAEVLFLKDTGFKGMLSPKVYVNPFIGKRYRDFLVIKEIERLRGTGELYSPKAFVTALSLRFNLHCNYWHEQLPPIVNSNLGFDEACVFYLGSENVGLVKTHKASIENTLKSIDQTRDAQEALLLGGMGSKTLVVDPSFVTGFVDGDGGINPTVVVEAHSVRFRTNFSCTSSSSNIYNLKIVDYYFRQFDWGVNEKHRGADFISKIIDPDRLTPSLVKKDYRPKEAFYGLRYGSLTFFKGVLAPHFLEYKMETYKNNNFLVCNSISESITSSSTDLKEVNRLVDLIYGTFSGKGGNSRKTPLDKVKDLINSNIGQMSNNLVEQGEDLLEASLDPSDDFNIEN